MTTIDAMAAVLDNVVKSKVSKNATDEDVCDDELEDAVEDGSAVNKKRRKRRKKKAQTNGKSVFQNDWCGGRFLPSPGLLKIPKF